MLFALKGDILMRRCAPLSERNHFYAFGPDFSIPMLLYPVTSPKLSSTVLTVMPT